MMKTTLMTSAILILTLNASTVPASDGSSGASYRVTIAPDPKLTAQIEAELPSGDGTLSMAGWGADFLPRGWASHVSRLRAWDEQGAELVVEAVEGKAAWRIAPVPPRRVRIDYSVDLGFTGRPWPPGNEQAGIEQDGALFLVTKSLFVTASTQAGSKVAFELPSGWRLSTPWSVGEAANTFTVKNVADLLDNSLVAGRYAEVVASVGNIRVVAALLGPMGSSKDALFKVVGSAARFFGGLFPSTPTMTYLITVFRQTERDAEAFARSCAFSEPEPLTADTVIVWGTTIAHELFHSWNGHAIQASDYAATQWFSEGFTEYFANLALVQTGVITEEEMLGKVATNLALYRFFRWSPAFAGVSLKDAGAKKGTYRLGVYSGGWAAAFCLDTLIIREQQGARSVKDMMRLLYERYGRTDQKYSLGDLVQAASEAGGRDLTVFFDDYVFGTKELPVFEALARIGLRGYGAAYSGELTIRKDRAASGDALAARRVLFSGGGKKVRRRSGR